MSTPRSFTPDERRTWVPLAALLELLPRQLDAQLIRDEELTHFDYFALSMLVLEPEHRLRMTALASMTNATLPRLSHVVTRLEKRGFVRRDPAPDDARATDVVITQEGRRKVIHATPGHVANVRHYVLDALEPEQFEQLRDIARSVLARLDPEGRMIVTRQV
ncbi:MAG TPA: MarR family transcriptional regulator [Gryllotalpicola sp.]